MKINVLMGEYGVVSFDHDKQIESGFTDLSDKNKPNNFWLNFCTIGHCDSAQLSFSSSSKANYYFYGVDHCRDRIDQTNGPLWGKKIGFRLKLPSEYRVHIKHFISSYVQEMDKSCNLQFVLSSSMQDT